MYDFRMFRPGYRFLYSLKKCWLNPKWYYHEAKVYYDRATKGYSYYDAMDFDQYIGTVIANAIEELSKYGCGYPVNMRYDEWVDILYRISKGLKDWQAFVDNDDDIPSDEYMTRYEEERAKLDEALQLFSTHFTSLWS